MTIYRLSIDCAFCSDMEIGLFYSKEKAREAINEISPEDKSKLGKKVAFFITPIKFEELHYPVDVLQKVVLL